MRSLARRKFGHAPTYTPHFTKRVENHIVPKFPRFDQTRSSTIQFLCITLEFVCLFRPTYRKYFQKSSNLITERVGRKGSFCATGSIYLPPFL